MTVGDISARRIGGWDQKIMIASVLAEKLQGIADATDKSTAGTAKPFWEFEEVAAKIRSVSTLTNYRKF